MEATPKSAVVSLDERRKAKAREQIKERPPRRRRSAVMVHISHNGKLGYGSSNLSRRNALKMLLGLYIMAGRCFQALGSPRK